MSKVFQVKCIKYGDWCRSVKKNDVIYVRERPGSLKLYEICRGENDYKYDNVCIRKENVRKVLKVYLGGE